LLGFSSDPDDGGKTFIQNVDYISIRLHGITSKKTVLFIVAGVTTSNPIVSSKDIFSIVPRTTLGTH
jgi:hypothetical protein